MIINFVSRMNMYKVESGEMKFSGIGISYIDVRDHESGIP